MVTSTGNEKIADEKRNEPNTLGSNNTSALNKQVGGSHYRGLPIQPVVYIFKNSIPFMEGSVIKYVTRWRYKGGIADLNKAKHFLELLIELEQASMDEYAKADTTGEYNGTSSERNK